MVTEVKKQSDKPTRMSRPGRGKAERTAGIDVAIDARQKPLTSNAQLRRLADQERAKRLAYRERSSFETRFLHYDD